MKTLIRRLVRVAFYAGLLLVAVWWFGLEGESPRVLFTSPPPRPLFPEALLRPISLDVEDRPLDEVLQELSALYGVPIQFDPEVLRKTMLTGKELVSLKIDRVPMYGVLSYLVQTAHEVSQSLVVHVKDGIAIVTIDSVWYSTRANFETRVYPLEELLAAPNPIHEWSLGIAIESTIAPQSWTTASNATFGCWEPVPGALVVVQTPDVHDQIQRLLDYLQRCSGGTVEPQPADISDPCLTSNEDLRHKLQRRIDVEFRNTPFHAVLSEIGKKSGIPIVLEPDAIEHGTLTKRFSFRLHDVPVSTVVNLLCSDLSLNHSVISGAVLITQSRPQWDFPWPTLTTVQSLLDVQSRLKVDSTQIKQWLGSFRENGTGTGAAWDGHLLLSGTPNFHQEMNGEIAAIRKPSRRYVDSEPAQLRPVEWGGTRSIRELATHLADGLGVNVWVNAETLRREGRLDVDREQPWPNATASIDEYLQRDDLTLKFSSVIRDDVIVLTTLERAKQTTVDEIGHWLGNRECFSDRWERLQPFCNVVGIDKHQARLQDVITIRHDWLDRANRRDAIRAISRCPWPPRGKLASWEELKGTTEFCAFDVGPVLRPLQSVRAQRLADSPNWYFAPLLFADLATPGPESILERESTSQHLVSALDAVISLTVPTHSDGVDFEILDYTALALIGPNDAARVTSVLQTLIEQIEKSPRETIEAVRLDAWNIDRRLDETTACLYDVRSLLRDRPNLREIQLRELIQTLTPPSIVKRYQYQAKDVELLPGFLVVVHDWGVQRSIAALLNYLRSHSASQSIESAGHSRPIGVSSSILANYPDWFGTVIADLKRDSDPVCNNFRVWLLSQPQLDASQFVTPMIEHLERAIATKDITGCVLIASSLVHHKSAADRILPLLRKAIAQTWESSDREQLIEMLSKAGQPDSALLFELLESDELLVQETARRSIQAIGSTAVPDLLIWFDRTRRKEFLLTLDAIDPVRSTTRLTLQVWDQSDEPEYRERAARLRTAFREQQFELEN